MKLSPTSAVALAAVALSLPACDFYKPPEQHHHESHKVVVTSPRVQDVVLTQEYVCQIHSQRHIDVCALEDGYLEPIPIKEGQLVKQGDVLFTIWPVLYQATLDAALAEVRAAEVELEQSKKLLKDRVTSQVDVALHEAKLAKAKAEAQKAQAELNFTKIKASFDGIIDRLHQQQGSLVKEGDMLTTMSDNSLMWVYFNVPEARYLEYMENRDRKDESEKIQLRLANHMMFPQLGQIGAIEAQFNNENGNIPFRADFPNPDRLLRHGQTGTVVISRTHHGALVIPQRAVYEILAKRYVWVIEPIDPNAKRAPAGEGHEGEGHTGEGHAGEHTAVGEQFVSVEVDPATGHAAGGHAAAGEHHAAGESHDGHETGKKPDGRGIVRQREIEVRDELEDIFLISKGLDVNDKIILEGVRQVRDGDEVEYEFKPPDEVLSDLKYHAE